MNNQLKNDRFLKALNRQPVDRTPVWLMRQAGRYLPEYLKVRKQAGHFMALCKNPQLCCQVALQPVDRFDLDAAILFSDILTIPDAMGLGLSFVENHGPQFARPIQSHADINNLPIIDPNDSLNYVMQAVAATKQGLGNRVPLIGFSGSPWTLATYMVEGCSSRTFAKTKGLLYSEPQHADQLIANLVTNVSHYLIAQIQAGVDAVMIFDTWGGVLTFDAYQRYSLEPMGQIIKSIKQFAADIPVILFTKGGGQWLESIADSGCDALGLDWTVNIAAARERVGERVALQGNLDPGILHGSEQAIVDESIRILEAFGHYPGHIFNLGHGIEPSVDPNKVKIMVDAVHNYKSAR